MHEVVDQLLSILWAMCLALAIREIVSVHLVQRRLISKLEEGTSKEDETEDATEKPSADLGI